MRNFKKLVIEVKNKYVYLTFDDKKPVVQMEKDRFTLDMNYYMGCRCKNPIFPDIRSDDKIKHYGGCQRCKRPIDVDKSKRK